MYSMLLSANRVMLDVSTNGFIDGLIKTVAGILIGILAGALIYVIFKDGAEYYKANGQASIVKIVIKCVVILIIMGLILVVATNYKSIAQIGKNVADKAVTVVDQEVSKLPDATDGEVIIGGEAKPQQKTGK